MKLYRRIKRKIKYIILSALHKLGSKTQAPLSTEDIREIIEYRKNIKIYDAFIFYNELETLEIRMNILDPYVDFFVIVECTETFSGMPKKLYFKDNAERFKQFEHKIIHHTISDAPKNEDDLKHRLANGNLSQLDKEIIRYSLTNDNVPKGEDFWLREFYQRESIQKALVGLADNDFCFVSDVDEIWNGESIIDYRSDAVFKMRQKMYSYYLNNRSSEAWAGTFATKYRNIKNGCLNDLRDATKTNYTYIQNGGWHFTNQGGAERIKSKLESYSHKEFNTVEIKSVIDKKIAENVDFVGRDFKFWTDEKGLPKYLLENKQKYPGMFR